MTQDSLRAGRKRTNLVFRYSESMVLAGVLPRARSRPRDPSSGGRWPRGPLSTSCWCERTLSRSRTHTGCRSQPDTPVHRPYDGLPCRRPSDLAPATHRRHSRRNPAAVRTRAAGCVSRRERPRPAVRLRSASRVPFADRATREAVPAFAARACTPLLARGTHGAVGAAPACPRARELTQHAPRRRAPPRSLRR